jgi:hypothetical protein
MDANSWIQTPMMRSGGRWPGIGDPHQVLWQLRGGEMFVGRRDCHQSPLPLGSVRLHDMDELIAWRALPQRWEPSKEAPHGLMKLQAAQRNLEAFLEEMGHSTPTACRFSGLVTSVCRAIFEDSKR